MNEEFINTGNIIFLRSNVIALSHLDYDPYCEEYFFTIVFLGGGEIQYSNEDKETVLDERDTIIKEVVGG